MFTSSPYVVIFLLGVHQVALNIVRAYSGTYNGIYKASFHISTGVDVDDEFGILDLVETVLVHSRCIHHSHKANHPFPAVCTVPHCGSIDDVPMVSWLRVAQLGDMLRER